MKTLVFGGSSDDTFGEITPRGNDYDNCASGEPIEYRLDSREGSLIVFGQYCPGSAAGWLVGIAPVDGGDDAQAIPAWPIRIRAGERCYSPAIEIDAPDDVTLRCLQRPEESNASEIPRFKLGLAGGLVSDADGDWISYNTFKLRRNAWSAVVDAQITLIEELRSKLAEREKEPQK